MVLPYLEVYFSPPFPQTCWTAGIVVWILVCSTAGAQTLSTAKHVSKTEQFYEFACFLGQ